MNNDERDAIIRDTHDAVIAIRSGCKTCRATVAAHDTALRGNGRAGLAARVGKLELIVCTVGGALAIIIVGGLLGWGLGKF
jgi:hypothetical protein